MADEDDVRAVALSLPGVVEMPSEGFDFRVSNKGFVWSYPERRPGQRRRSVPTSPFSTSATRPRSRRSCWASPRSSSLLPGYDGWPLVMLNLDQVDVARLTELVTDAWRMRAADDLVDDSSAVDQD